ncbi:MAG: DUF72 domain-containing protein [Bdellovibrionota bacterium]
MRKNDLQESFNFTQPPSGPAVQPPFDPRELARLAARGVYLGTCSWKYRGWEGMIYQGGYASEAQFQRSSLREYTSAFPTVSVDFTYFAWPLRDMMAYLVESTPENFKLCPKVTKRITLSSFPNLPAYGKWAGQPNPDYLNAELFKEQFLAPISVLKDRMGVVIFEFSGPDVSELEAFEKFFRTIPRDFPYAVEIRNPALVTPEFYSLLRSLELAPVFSHWTKMPSVYSQFETYLKSGGSEDQGPLVAISLVRSGRSFEEAVSLFQPYGETKDVYQEARTELAMIGTFAMQSKRKAYILVSNRLEGSAPFTIGAVAEGILTKRD